MRALVSLIAVVFVTSLGPPPTAADELVDAARRERARREALRQQRDQKGSKAAAESAVPVLSNGDLRRISGTVSVVGRGVSNGGGSPAPPAKTAAAVAGATEGEATEAVEEQDEAYWRERQKNARARVEEMRAELKELNIKINDLRRQATSIADPHIRYQKTQELYAAVARVPELQKEIRAAERHAGGIREEGRKAGAPAGWFR